MSKSWSGGSTRGWRKVRAAVLLRDRGRCRLRIEGVCTGVATCVHHTQGRASTGDNPKYLVAACDACNLATGDPMSKDPSPRPLTRW